MGSAQTRASSNSATRVPGNGSPSVAASPRRWPSSPRVTVTEDVVLYRARILLLLDGAELAAVGTFVLRGGLIWRQTMGVVPLPG